MRLFKPEMVEDHVLYHAMVVVRCTKQRAYIPAAVLHDDVLWVAANLKHTVDDVGL